MAGTRPEKEWGAGLSPNSVINTADCQPSRCDATSRWRDSRRVAPVDNMVCCDPPRVNVSTPFMTIDHPRAFRARFDPATSPVVAPADLPLLLAAERAGIAWPSSCRNGTCRTCIAQLVEGRVSYRIEWPGLSAEEKLAGRILPCVAYPASNVSLQKCAEGF